MKRLLTAACLALISGCAATPEAETAAVSSECERVAGELAKNEQAYRAALRKRQAAWKAVIPVAVAAIYVAADAEAADAEQRRSALERELKARGCSEGA